MPGHLTENVKLRIDRETLDALERLAKEGDRSVAAEMRRAIRKHVGPSCVIELPPALSKEEAEQFIAEFQKRFDA